MPEVGAAEDGPTEWPSSVAVPCALWLPHRQTGGLGTEAGAAEQKVGDRSACETMMLL